MQVQSRTEYLYLTLKEIAEQTTNLLPKHRIDCNTFALVADCSAPRNTRGTDWVSNVLLVDPTTEAEGSNLQKGIECLLFASDPSALPATSCAGDILRLHRVTAQAFNNRLQLVGKIGSACAFCLFAGHGQDMIPSQVASATYSISDMDSRIVLYLRQFKRNHQHPFAGTHEYMKRIRDVRPGDYFDCYCKVLAVEDHEADMPAAFFIWDGTDAFPFPTSADTRQERQPEESEKGTAWDSAERKAIRFEAVPGTFQLPSLGAALPVILYNLPQPGDRSQASRSLPKRGAWIKLRNVVAWVIKGQLQARFISRSKWSPAQVDDAILAGIRRREHSGQVSEWAPSAPVQWAAAAREMTSMPFTTLRQILAQAGVAAPARYKCLVRLLEHHPADVADFCQPIDVRGASDGSRGSDRRWRFALKLRLEDGTADADALLYGQDGEDFFQVAAQDLRQNEAAASEVEAKMSHLLGEHADGEAGIWMACCLKTFWSDRAHPWQSMHLRLLATTMCGAPQ
ncbi:hypothetical protein WJX84_004579 [Apatococcus fuscideae]|uniref:Telomeric single stranded DNA binding POT1/Cdc13 domain-containing protein n=1 Tax=Apatococcus fuscideae TaxID=2026836 RepID=A0AAW1SSS9_9CHLO